MLFVREDFFDRTSPGRDDWGTDEQRFERHATERLSEARRVHNNIGIREQLTRSPDGADKQNTRNDLEFLGQSMKVPLVRLILRARMGCARDNEGGVGEVT